MHSPVAVPQQQQEASRFPFGSDDQTLRGLLAQSVRRSARSREQLADDLSRLLNRRITVNSINNWTAPGREVSLLPAAFVRAVCECTGDDALRRFLLGPKLATLLRLGEAVARVLPCLLSKYEKQHRLSDSEDTGAQNDLF